MRRRKVPSPVPVQSVDVWLYRPGRSIRAGDRLRVRGGPYWLAANGDRISLGERGVYTFVRLVLDQSGLPIAAECASRHGCVLLPADGVGRGSSDVRGLSGYVPAAYRYIRLRPPKQTGRKRKRLRKARGKGVQRGA